MKKNPENSSKILKSLKKILSTPPRCIASYINHAGYCSDKNRFLKNYFGKNFSCNNKITKKSLSLFFKDFFKTKKSSAGYYLGSYQMDRGYTLIELLITMGILAILGGISTISYSKYVLYINKSSLHTSAKHFATSVHTCINAVGGWEIKVKDQDGVDKDDTPCKAEGTTEAETKEDLKEKLNFDCPEDATCETLFNTSSKFYCLFIRTTKQSVVIQVNTNSPSTYNIFCGNGRAKDGFVTTPGNCRNSHKNKTPSPQINKLVNGNRGTNAEQCDW